MKTVTGHKQLHVAGRKQAGDGTPEVAQLAAINAYAIRELKAEEVYVRTMYLAHNGIDRDGEVMDSALLADFARTLPGKGLFIKHPMSFDGDTGPGEGRFFEARVVMMSFEDARAALREPGLQFPPGAAQAELLEASFYMLRTPGAAELIAKIDGGVAGDVSIGFRASGRTDVLDDTGDVIARRLHAPGEAFEGSLVWLGAQPGARIHKQANLFEEEQSMNIEELKSQNATLAKQLDDQRKDLDTAKAEAKAATKTLEAIKTATGVDAATDEGLAALREMKAFAEAGRQHKQALIDDIVQAERLAGLIDDTDEAVAASKAHYADAGLERLEKTLDKVKALVPEGGQLTGGDPNSTGAPANRKAMNDAERDDFNPLQNKALAG